MERDEVFQSIVESHWKQESRRTFECTHEAY